MQSVRQIERLNQTELDKCIPPNASWHTDYRDTAYVYIGGLPYELSEGDIVTIFSQYGNPTHINLIRDKETGKSKGFCFLKYEDQKSCDLAVDNLSGAGVMGRLLSVDHTRYKRKEGEEDNNLLHVEVPDADDTDREGDDRRKRRRTESESEEERPLIKEEIELAKLLKDHDDDDPMKSYMVEQKREEVAEALKKIKLKKKDRRGDRERKHKHKHHHRSRREEEDGQDGKRERHHSRRNGEGREDEGSGRDRPERSHRNEGRNEDDRQRIPHRSRRDRSRTSDSDREDNRRRHRSRKGEPQSDEERSRRKPSRERSVSREPYRRR